LRHDSGKISKTTEITSSRDNASKIIRTLCERSFPRHPPSSASSNPVRNQHR